MIPQKLTVKNFMCYRDNVPPLELDGIHVACLCGDNGNGKTALLDAITWALWGQARARTQEELIHQGRQDMAVELEFLARGQRYRANRRYSLSGRGSRGKTSLELQVVSENGVRPITGNTIGETEKQIRELLHMDYDTFVNTAFLLQGQADLFTRSTPAQRKERLAEVLDLSYYKALEERAKERSRGAQDGIRDTDGAIGVRRQEVSEKPDYQTRLTAVRTTLSRIGPEADAQQAKVEELRGSVDSLRARREEMNALERRLGATGTEISELDRQVRAHQERLRDYEAALDDESETRRQFASLEEARAELERFERASFHAMGLDRQRAELGKVIAVEREALSWQAAQLQSRITDELEPRARDLTRIEEEVRQTTEEETKLDELDGSLRLRREEAQSVAGRLRYLEEANASLHAGMEETRRKFDMLREDDPLCPLCQKPLGSEGQEHLRREYEAEGREAKRRYQENEAEQRQLGTEHRRLLDETSRQEADLERERRSLQSKAASLERGLQECRTSKEALGPARRELEMLRAGLAQKRYAEAAQRRLGELEGEISALGYDDEKHRRAQESVKGLEPFAEAHRRLLEAVEAVPGERQALQAAERMLQRRRQETEEDERRREALSRERESLPSLEAELRAAESAHRSLEEERQAALVQQGVLTQQLDRLARLESELDELDKRRAGLVDEKAIWDELAVAFGKNGVQALIIETAIPQLQDDANELLGRLTDHRMTLKLQLAEGRRERRMGLPSEELQIRIADEVGTRSYETFSGGEAFRINFALRIALSKLLARRSGAPLPTLFIDEGFGTQDASGQERLKEAIQSIQSDFEKIIVITHVEQVKDAFPVRIEVTKTGSGSTFDVV